MCGLIWSLSNDFKHPHVLQWQKCFRKSAEVSFDWLSHMQPDWFQLVLSYADDSLGSSSGYMVHVSGDPMSRPRCFSPTIASWSHDTPVLQAWTDIHRLIHQRVLVLVWPTESSSRWTESSWRHPLVWKYSFWDSMFGCVGRTGGEELVAVGH